MSKPIPAINRYRADLRELHFLLFEQIKIEEILGQGKFESWDADAIKSTLTEMYKWCREVTGPLNATADAEGCHLENGAVTTPKGFKEAWKKLYDAGWKSIGVDAEYGGAGAPRVVQLLVEEMLSGSNTAFSMYSGLTYGAAEVVEAFGTPEQQKLFAERMYSGVWGGTMCLTEPHAGSDVGSARTKATPNGDGTYNISGTKIFISAGDHDLTDNIIHLVLARVPDAPAGTKGLTLFIVPKVRTDAAGKLGESNDVAVGNIEHKMGINGSSTCVLNFGENGKCLGVPVGGDAKLNQGMSQMFKLMNSARIAVGMQGYSVASAAFLNALDYARERKQGPSIKAFKDPTAPRVSIIEHADVRRMLLDMKSKVEGIRALAVKLAHHQDMSTLLEGKDDQAVAYHRGQVDLLVPLVKAYGSDQGFRVCETAIQTYGGAGYTRDYPVEQYCRDAKIFSIYEGTNHIQAMDLVGRKLAQGGGVNLQQFGADVAKFVAKNVEHPKLANEVKSLGKAQEAITRSAMKLLMWFQTGQLEMVPLVANRFLEMMSELAVSWLLLDAAVIADEKVKSVAAGHPDVAFYAGKVAAAQYYARNVLPGVEEKARQLDVEDRTALDIPDAAFASL
ncbi:MAG: Acyl-CoA dehydrogenase [Myxococcales bacterium]|nr:Acyl-CoA dehydrogenase [Myxococcales bacterium]